jgi:hypothetical protein
MEFLAWLQSRSFSLWISESSSLLAYPSVLLVHTIGLAIVVGANVVIDLRMLGAGRQVPLSTLNRVYRPMWYGFTINAISGFLLFAAQAEWTGVKPVFWLKLALIGAALVITVVIRRTVFNDPGASDRPIPDGVKWLAIVSLILWAGGITAGRYTAYL